MERLDITQRLKLKPAQLQFLRDSIERAGKSENQVAIAIGVPRANMSAMLSGNRPINEKDLRAICAEAGIRCIVKLEVDIYR